MKPRVPRFPVRHPWALALVVLGFLLALFGVYRYLISDAFQLELRGRIVRYLENATGGKIDLQGFRFDPLRGQAILSRFQLKRDDDISAPFLDIDRITVGFSLRSPFARKQLELRSVTVEKPRINLNTPPRRDARPGRTTFIETVFRVAVSQVDIREARVEIENSSIPLDMHLSDLSTRLEIDPTTHGYRGELQFNDSRVAVGGWTGEQISLKTDLGFYSQGVELSDGVLRFAETTAYFSGMVANLYSPDLRFDFHVDGQARDIQNTLHKDVGVEGAFTAQGRLTLTDGRLDTNGTFRSPSLVYARFRPRDVEGSFVIDRDTLRLGNIKFNLLRGTGTATLSMDWTQPGATGQGNIHLKNVDAREGLRALTPVDLRIAAQADSEIAVRWAPEPAGFSAVGEVRLLSGRRKGTAMEGGEPSVYPEGRLRVRYTEGRFEITDAQLLLGDGVITASGSVGPNQAASLDVSYDSRRLRESITHFTTLAGLSFSSLEPWIAHVAMDRIRFDGRFHGLSADSPLEGKLRLDRPRVGGAVWDSLDTAIVFGTADVRLSGLTLQQGHSVTQANARIVLGTTPGGDPKGFAELQGILTDVPIAQLLGAFRRHDPVEGMFSGTVELHGVFPDIEGHGEFEFDAPKLLGQEFRSARGALVLAGQRLELVRFSGDSNRKRVVANGWYDLRRKVFDVHCEGTGWDIHDIASAFQSADVDVQGGLDFNIQGRGSVNNPILRGRITATAATWKRFLFENTSTVFTFADHVADISMETELLGGRLKLRGKSIWQDPEPVVSADVQFESVNPFALEEFSAEKGFGWISADVAGSATVTGPLYRVSEWRVPIQMSAVQLKIAQLDFRNVNPVALSVSEGKISFSPVDFQSNENRFSLSGDIVLQPEPQLDLRVKSIVDLEPLNNVLDQFRVGGSANVAVSLQGPPSAPKTFGSCRLTGVSLRLDELNYGLTGLEGIVVFNENLARVINVRASLSTGGAVTFNGTVNLEKLKVKNFVVLTHLEQALFRIPQGFRTISNADLVLRGDLSSQMLVGNVDIGEASYNRSVDLLAQIAEAASNRTPLSRAPNPALDNISLDLTVDFKNGMSFNTDTVRLTADGRLRVLGPASKPSLLGRISANSGEISFMGNHYAITKGGVEFVNPLRVEPHFDLAAETTIKGYRINLMLRGTPDSIQPDLRSEPPLPVLDLITLLSAGVTSQELVGDASGGRSNVGLAASNLLAEGLSRQVESRVQRVLGFRQFKIDPFLAGKSNNPTARVTLERRLSSNLSVTYSTDITTAQEQIVLVEITISPRYSLVASRDENGNFGLDFRIQRKF